MGRREERARGGGGWDEAEEGNQWRRRMGGEEKQRRLFRDGGERVKERRAPFTPLACGNSRLARAGLLDSLDGRADGGSGSGSGVSGSLFYRTAAR